MAITKLAKNGPYAVLELNQVAFPRDGRIEAQLPLSADTSKGGFSKEAPAEVGMVLVVDKANDCVRKALAADIAATSNAIFAINYSTEHMYDERVPQLDQFCMYPADPDSYDYRTGFHDDFYPRMGFLAVGDRFTTNAIMCDTATVKVGTLVYVGTDGYWTTDATAKVGPVCQIVEDTTCPNAIDRAFKLVVIKA